MLDLLLVVGVEALGLLLLACAGVLALLLVVTGV
jgi:hypothetical protein